MRLIDADAALKALRECQTYLYDARDPELKIELSSAEAAINNLPTIQPEPRTGKWTLGFDNRYMEKYYYCSRCGCRKYGEHEPLDYFCSNCGADMRCEQDGH